MQIHAMITPPLGWLPGGLPHYLWVLSKSGVQNFIKAVHKKEKGFKIKESKKKKKKFPKYFSF